MKKYIVSFMLIATFAVYAVYQKINGSIGGSIATGVSVVAGIAPIIATPTTQSTASASAAPTSTAISTKTKTTTTITKQVSSGTVITSNPGQYKNGQYTGTSVNSYYGNIQVAVTISGGAISDIQFLSYPNDRGTSVRINNQAMPILKQEAITAQSANVDTVSGATDSSGAFRQSLGSALAQAMNS